MRDGIDNGKDVISLVNMTHTSPHNRLATRATPRECVETGVVGSHQVVPEPADVDDLLAYIQSLTAEPNPNVPQFAEAAKRGKRLFEGKADCTTCHPGPYFTDKKTHNVGITQPERAARPIRHPVAHRGVPHGALLSRRPRGHDEGSPHGARSHARAREPQGPRAERSRRPDRLRALAVMQLTPQQTSTRRFVATRRTSSGDTLTSFHPSVSNSCW